MKRIVILIILNLIGINTLACELTNKEISFFGSEVHPTQPNLGYAHVNRKVKKFMKLQSQGKLDKEIKSYNVPVVISPKHEIFILDRHHTITAYLKIEGYWSNGNSPSSTKPKSFEVNFLYSVCLMSKHFQ